MMGSPLARATEAPGRGCHWGMEAHHPSCRAACGCEVGTVGTMEQILHGPSTPPTAR